MSAILQYTPNSIDKFISDVKCRIKFFEISQNRYLKKQIYGFNVKDVKYNFIWIYNCDIIVVIYMFKSCEISHLKWNCGWAHVSVASLG